MMQLPNLAPPPLQPAFPRVQFQINPQGVAVIIQLGPSTLIQQMLSPLDMDTICTAWTTNKENMAQLMQAVQNSKNQG